MVEPISLAATIIAAAISATRRALRHVRHHARAVEELLPLADCMEDILQQLTKRDVAEQLSTQVLTNLKGIVEHIEELEDEMSRRSFISKLWNGSEDLRKAERLENRLSHILILINTNLAASNCRKDDEILSELRKFERMYEMRSEPVAASHHYHHREVQVCPRI